ncbi:unnamed protein product [Orchesella dallaii]|uniref:ABC transmembrane type-1 domain-containing protein n=1 Tax=Orchesella dallaii TaxID=48710 RepID=A0ABP1S8R1_9HEXA
MFQKATDLAYALNQYILFLKELQDDFMPAFNPRHMLSSWKFELLVLLLTVLFPLLGFLSGCHFTMFPNWPLYLTSLLPDDFLQGWFLACFSVAWFMALQIAWINLSTACIIGSMIFAYLNKLLLEFISDSPSWTQLTMGSFRELETIKRNYRKLQVIDLVTQNVVSTLLRPLVTVVTNQVVFCNYSIIRHAHTISLPILIILSSWSLVGILGLLVGLRFAGETHSLGKRVLRSMKYKDWGSKQKNKEVRKFVRSCKPISFSCGRSFVLRKISVLKSLKAVVRGTFRALLAIQ